VDWVDSDHVTCVPCDACPFHDYISKSPGGFRAATNSSSSSSSGGRSTQASTKLEEYRRVQEVNL
jgi:hypothetical protein